MATLAVGVIFLVSNLANVFEMFTSLGGELVPIEFWSPILTLKHNNNNYQPQIHDNRWIMLHMKNILNYAFLLGHVICNNVFIEYYNSALH